MGIFGIYYGFEVYMPTKRITVSIGATIIFVCNIAFVFSDNLMWVFRMGNSDSGFLSILCRVYDIVFLIRVNMPTVCRCLLVEECANKFEFLAITKRHRSETVTYRDTCVYAEMQRG